MIREKADPTLIASPRSVPARDRRRPAIVARASRWQAVVAGLNSGVSADYYPVRSCHRPAVVAGLRSSPARTCHRPALIPGPRSSPARARLRPALVSGPRSSHGLVAGQRSSPARTLAESGVSGSSPQMLSAYALHPCCISWRIPVRVLQPTDKPFGARHGARALSGPSTGPAQPTHPPNAIPAAKLEVSRYLAPIYVSLAQIDQCGSGHHVDAAAAATVAHGAKSCGPHGAVACGPRSAFQCGPCGAVKCSQHNANACGAIV